MLRAVCCSRNPTAQQPLPSLPRVTPSWLGMKRGLSVGAHVCGSKGGSYGRCPCMHVCLSPSWLTVLQHGHLVHLRTEVTVPDVIGGFQAQFEGSKWPQSETQKSHEGLSPSPLSCSQLWPQGAGSQEQEALSDQAICPAQGGALRQPVLSSQPASRNRGPSGWRGLANVKAGPGWRFNSGPLVSLELLQSKSPL